MARPMDHSEKGRRMRPESIAFPPQMEQRFKKVRVTDEGEGEVASFSSSPPDPLMPIFLLTFSISRIDDEDEMGSGFDVYVFFLWVR